MKARCGASWKRSPTRRPWLAPASSLRAWRMRFATRSARSRATRACCSRVQRRQGRRSRWLRSSPSATTCSRRSSRSSISYARRNPSSCRWTSSACCGGWPPASSVSARGPRRGSCRGAPGVLLADEGLLERAFENLVRNAREAGSGTRAGRGPRDAGRDLRHRRRNGRRAGAVARDERPRRPFVTTKPGGLGLGLPTAIKIIQLHGGTLSLAKREDTRGAVARVRLPLPIDRVVT